MSTSATSQLIIDTEQLNNQPSSVSQCKLLPELNLINKKLKMSKTEPYMHNNSQF